VFFLPECTKDGLYKQKQCHASTGDCWCVDPVTGAEIPGTRKGLGEGDVDCSGTKLTKCLTEKASAMESDKFGVFIPECTKDGLYKQKQCHASTGNCWCVDPVTGVEIPGTRKGLGEGDVDCSVSVTKLASTTKSTTKLISVTPTSVTPTQKSGGADILTQSTKAPTKAMKITKPIVVKGKDFDEIKVKDDDEIMGISPTITTPGKINAGTITPKPAKTTPKPKPSETTPSTTVAPNVCMACPCPCWNNICQRDMCMLPKQYFGKHYKLLESGERRSKTLRHQTGKHTRKEKKEKKGKMHN